MRRTIISLLAISLLFCASAQTYKKATAPVDARVEDLLSRMTLEEKVQQFTMHGLGAVPHMSESFGVCDSPFDGLELIATQSKAAKKHAKENTRLGIPPIQIAECLHGLLAYGATIYPQAIAQGSTWNPGLIEEMASQIAREASSVGVD